MEEQNEQEYDWSWVTVSNTGDSASIADAQTILDLLKKCSPNKIYVIGINSYVDTTKLIQNKVFKSCEQGLLPPRSMKQFEPMTKDLSTMVNFLAGFTPPTPLFQMILGILLNARLNK